MKKTTGPREPIDPARIRTIEGSFSWIDHRFIPMMEDLGRDENLLYLWLVAVGDRLGVSFYSDEKTASRIKLTVGEIGKARRRLIARGLIAYRDGLSQVLALPVCPAMMEAPPREGSDHVPRRPRDTHPLPPGCPRAVVPPDRPAGRDLAKHRVQDILRMLEGAAHETGRSARSLP